MGATIRCSLFLWTASYVFRLLCRSPRMSFFYPCPGISPQRCSAPPSGRSWQNHIPFGRSFSFQFAPQLVGSEKGRKLTPSAKLFERRLYDKKGRYTAHQISGRKSLAISLMKLCTGSEIQKPSKSAFSAPQAEAAPERRLPFPTAAFWLII